VHVATRSNLAVAMVGYLVGQASDGRVGQRRGRSLYAVQPFSHAAGPGSAGAAVRLVMVIGPAVLTAG
jgi:hypothetical protein